MIYVKSLSGEVVEVENDTNEDMNEEYILSYLHKINPIMYPSFRTSLIKDEVEDYIYYSYVDEKLNVCLYTNSAKENCVYIDKIYSQKNENKESIDLEDSEDRIGEVLDEYRGCYVLNLRFNLSDKMYKLFVISVDWYERGVYILYSCDIQECDNLSDEIEKKIEENEKSDKKDKECKDKFIVVFDCSSAEVVFSRFI